MVQKIQAQNITLRDLIDRFDLQFVEDLQFFPEWQENLPEITDSEKQQLDKVKAGYINLLNYPPLLENVVRMSVLDPILFIGDFYLSPFHVKAEKSVTIAEEDEGIIVTGSLDILVLRDQFWVMAIESKKATFSIEAGRAQLLAYMLANPHPERPSFGMITTGGSFIFIKLIKCERPQYGLSKTFTTLNTSNELYDAMRILKRLSQLINSN